MNTMFLDSVATVDNAPLAQQHPPHNAYAHAQRPYSMGPTGTAVPNIRVAPAPVPAAAHPGHASPPPAMKTIPAAPFVAPALPKPAHAHRADQADEIRARPPLSVALFLAVTMVMLLGASGMAISALVELL